MITHFATIRLVFNKIKTSVVWWLGGSTVLSVIIYLFQGDLILAALAFALSFIVFPPFTDVVLVSKHPRLFKLLIVLAVIGLVARVSSLEDKRKALDKVEIENLARTTQTAAAYCRENVKCADDIGQLKNMDSAKYEYQLIDGGKDCVVHTILPSGKNRSDICIDGNNIEYLKYLR